MTRSSAPCSVPVSALFAALLAPVLAMVLLAGPAASQATPPACGPYPVAEATLTCSCAADAAGGPVWGSNPYTGDSNLCTAARHAGVIGAEGGIVVVTRGPKAMAFEGSARNGVTSNSWGAYDPSLSISAPVAAVEGDCPARLPASTDSLACQCKAGLGGGSVWGSGPYTGDSSICAAARHAGIVGAEGGAVLATRTEGRSAYEGSTANGVRSSNWGSFRDSISVGPIPVSAPAPVVAASGPPALSAEDMARALASLPACKSMPAGLVQHDCVCAAGSARASVWGVGPYTGDSDICTAGIHAGAVAEGGGVLRVLAAPGLAAYAGSDSNGVTTRAWGGFGASITFDRNFVWK